MRVCVEGGGDAILVLQWLALVFIIVCGHRHGGVLLAISGPVLLVARPQDARYVYKPTRCTHLVVGCILYLTVWGNSQLRVM